MIREEKGNGKNYSICVGTVGGGLSHSPDGGEAWDRVRDPIPSECNVRALAVHPNDPHRILAGSDVGIFSREDGGDSWQKLRKEFGEIRTLALTPN